MFIKELLEGAIENDLIDLQALIMFLVFEKEVVSMEDDSSALDLYFLEKHSDKMNRELIAYKKKMNMNYGLYAYRIKSTTGIYYISAHSEAQAIYLAYKNGITILEIKNYDEHQLMDWNGMYMPLKSIMDKPKILGGYKNA